jgi:hypothetical protein
MNHRETAALHDETPIGSASSTPGYTHLVERVPGHLKQRHAG